MYLLLNTELAKLGNYDRLMNMGAQIQYSSYVHNPNEHRTL